MNKEQFPLSDGRQLCWYAKGVGRPLVLLHGWSMSSAAFSEVVELLSTDYRLFIPDLPGHGQSSPAAKNDFAGLASVLVDWLNAVVPQPFALAGWSLGGMLALHLAGQSPVDVDRLVLISTTPRFTAAADWRCGLPAGQVRALIRNLRRNFESTLAEFFALSFAGEALSQDRIRTIRNFAVRQAAMPDRRAATELLELLASQDQRAELGAIQQPALVMHGELDSIVPCTAGRSLSASLPGGCFLNFPGVGHAPFLSQPQLFADRLLEFC